MWLTPATRIAGNLPLGLCNKTEGAFAQGHHDKASDECGDRIITGGILLRPHKRGHTIADVSGFKDAS
jgi:hypothetical protein